jgi:hypothetical protein
MKAYRVVTDSGTWWYNRQSRALSEAADMALGISADETIEVETCELKPGHIITALNGTVPELDDGNVAQTIVVRGRGKG